MGYAGELNGMFRPNFYSNSCKQLMVLWMAYFKCRNHCRTDQILQFLFKIFINETHGFEERKCHVSVTEIKQKLITR